LIDNFNIDINGPTSWNQCSNVQSAMWHRISNVKTLFRIYFTSIVPSWASLTSMLQLEGELIMCVYTNISSKTRETYNRTRNSEFILLEVEVDFSKS